KEHFPEMFGPYLVKVNMSNFQFERYANHRRKERQDEGKKLFDGLPKRKGGGVAIPKSEGSTYRMMSRQLSNVAYPNDETNVENFTRFDELEEFSMKTLTFLKILGAHLSGIKTPDGVRPQLPKVDFAFDH